MDEAGHDWARRGAVAIADAGLTAFAAGGALLLWDAAAGRPGFANAAGRALLGDDAAEARLPAQATQRLDALAGGLASTAGIRLERLRLTSGFSAVPITCGCKLLALPEGGTVLAIAVSAAELRRLGIAIPPAQLAAASAAPQQAAASEPATPTPVKPATVRFLWQSDGEGRLTTVSENIALLAGSEAAAGLVGQRWHDLIGSTILDRDGGLAERFASPTTWSGHVLLWRSDVAGEGVKVELSGVPVLDAQRSLAGFRGFGLARLTERETFLAPAPPVAAQEAEAAIEDAGEETAGIPAPAEASVDAPSPQEPETPERSEAAEATAQDEPAPVANLPGKSEPAPPAEQDERGEAETEKQPAPTEAELAAKSDNIVPLRSETGRLTMLRPVLEPSKPNLSSAERNAFREIAKALGARLAGDEGEGSGPALPPAAPLDVKVGETRTDTAAKPTTESEHPGARQRNSHADVLDRLPIAVLVNRADEALYANRTLLDLLDYADLADLKAGGNVSRLIKEASRAGGGAIASAIWSASKRCSPA